MRLPLLFPNVACAISQRRQFFVEYAHRWGDRPVESLVSYGGSLSLMPRLNVQFGLRTTFDGTLRLDGLAPTIKLNGQTAGLLSSIPL